MISVGKSPQDLKIELAKRVEQYRLLKNLSRKSLSLLSGVPVSTIKVFETTGKISMDSFIALSFALNKTIEIEMLYEPSAPNSLAELKNSNRLRGRK